MVLLEIMLPNLYRKHVRFHSNRKKTAQFLQNNAVSNHNSIYLSWHFCKKSLIILPKTPFLQKLGKFIEKCSDLSKNQEYAHMKTLKILGTRFFIKKISKLEK